MTSTTHVGRWKLVYVKHFRRRTRRSLRPCRESREADFAGLSGSRRFVNRLAVFRMRRGLELTSSAMPVRLLKSDFEVAKSEPDCKAYETP